MDDQTASAPQMRLKNLRNRLGRLESLVSSNTKPGVSGCSVEEKTGELFTTWIFESNSETASFKTTAKAKIDNGANSSTDGVTLIAGPVDYNKDGVAGNQYTINYVDKDGNGQTCTFVARKGRPGNEGGTDEPMGGKDVGWTFFGGSASGVDATLSLVNIGITGASLDFNLIENLLGLSYLSLACQSWVQSCNEGEDSATENKLQVNEDDVGVDEEEISPTKVVLETLEQEMMAKEDVNVNLLNKLPGAKVETKVTALKKCNTI